MIGFDPFALWHPFIAKNESHTHLQANEKSSSGAATVRTHQTRKHGSLSGNRSGRRLRNGGTDGSLNDRTISGLGDKVAIRPEADIQRLGICIISGLMFRGRIFCLKGLLPFITYTSSTEPFKNKTSLPDLTKEHRTNPGKI